MHWIKVHLRMTRWSLRLSQGLKPAFSLSVGVTAQSRALAQTIHAMAFRRLSAARTVPRRLKWSWVFSSGMLLVVCTLLLSAATPEKHLSVYSVAANYALPLVQREGRDYVGLLELLEPLGRVSAKAEGTKWRLRYNNVQGEFQVGKTRARVQERETDLGGKFLMENQRGLVPVGALASLLPRILGGPVSLHEVADRLFIGSV